MITKPNRDAELIKAARDSGKEVITNDEGVVLITPDRSNLIGKWRDAHEGHTTLQ